MHATFSTGRPLISTGVESARAAPVFSSVQYTGEAHTSAADGAGQDNFGLPASAASSGTQSLASDSASASINGESVASGDEVATGSGSCSVQAVGGNTSALASSTFTADFVLSQPALIEIEGNTSLSGIADAAIFTISSSNGGAGYFTSQSFNFQIPSQAGSGSFSLQVAADVAIPSGSGGSRFGQGSLSADGLPGARPYSAASNGASGTPVELPDAFLRQFREFTATLTLSL